MIEIAGLSARAGSFVLDDVSFTIPQGGYGVVIGRAGSGKTTLLETIAGIIPARAGTVKLGGDDLTRAKPEARRLSLVYQHACLFPHLTVGENVAYGAADADASAEMLSRFGLGEVAHRSVMRLSGGERQLVALARALARRPEVLLLDEPFAALDPHTRGDVRREVRTIYFERHFTVLHVTHDFDEAGMLGDVAVLLEGGRVLQAGKPEQLFRKPATPFAAQFLGAENVFAGYVLPIRAASPDWEGPSDGERSAQPIAFNTGSLTVYALADVLPGYRHAVIRAEDVMLSLETLTTSVRNQFRGQVREIAPGGALTRVTIDVGGTPLVAAVTTRAVQELGLAPGRDVVAAFKATSVHIC